MKAWLNKILAWNDNRCPHKWVIINTNVCSLHNENTGSSQTWHQYTLQCDHCGDIKFTSSKGT